MKTPYVCANTVVVMKNGSKARVIGVDPENRVATVRSNHRVHVVNTNTLTVVSYKEVD